MSAMDYIVALISTLGHDVAHPGINNRFLVNSRDPLAAIYNDISVLENMHCSKLYEIMSRPNSDILGSLLVSDWQKLRKSIIDMILVTDLVKHFSLLGTFRSRSSGISDILLEVEEDRFMVQLMILKCSDIGHSSKPTDLHEKWSNLVCEEFFRQGDLEKQVNLPISMYCDRETTDIPKSQIGFLKGISQPLFEALGAFLNSDTFTQNCVEQVKRNIAFWEKKAFMRRSSLPHTRKSLLGKLPKLKSHLPKFDIDNPAPAESLPDFSA